MGKNMNEATPYGVKRWFDPVKARYIRVTVSYSVYDAGAMVSEVQVFGNETETVPLKRKPLVSRRIIFSIDVDSIPEEKVVYLSGPETEERQDRLGGFLRGIRG